MKTETLLLLLALLAVTPLSVAGQFVSVAGRVTDNLTGAVIRDLTVVEKNSGIGTITSQDGSFSLLLKPGDVLLHLFSENYELHTISFELKKDTVFQVPLSALRSDNFKRGKKESLSEESHSSFADNPVKEKKHR